MRELYAGAARLLLEKGFNVAFFTNGSFDDQAFLDECRPALMAPGGASPAGKITFAPHPKTPRELVRQISVFDGVIAHRLHANIIAYAYKIPHIGLGWDKKLPAFFHSVGRDAYALSVNESNAETIVARLENALAEGIDEKTHARVVREARDEIAQLARAIQAPANAVSSVLRGDEK
jgi:polysaccharide pyruvyl transferase WcaK-like protein